MDAALCIQHDNLPAVSDTILLVHDESISVVRLESIYLVRLDGMEILLLVAFARAQIRV